MNPPDPNLKRQREEAFEVAEAARETEWKHRSFAAGIFLGALDPTLAFPFPEQPEGDRRVGDAFAEKISAFLRANLDPDEVDRTDELPSAVVQGLVELGAFGMKIPKEYGGLGFSQANYNRVAALVASYCGAAAVWLSAHQSIGVPQPLKLFGTDEQKKRYFPRLARGALSAFALTEPGVGSDPARMTTTAVPSEDGKSWTLNGEKLWTTNGPVADLLVVMARTPSIVVDGRERKQITAFIVEGSSPGVSTVHRCSFMGLRGIQNGVMRFENVRVPAENVLWGVGKGLKLALVTLNTGRLTLPACCAGVGRRCLAIARRWAGERVQWGAPIGKHEAIASKIAWIASHVFAMESITDFATALVDRGGADVRIEAAMAKLFCSETLCRIVDELVQIRGGRGYETAASLRARGERPEPVELLFRDARINMIVEGTSEILRLFLAREALDPHLRSAGDLFKPGTTAGVKLAILGRCAAHYPAWYARQWLPLPAPFPAGLEPALARHLRFARRASRRLARRIFHRMVRHGPALERRGLLLGRFVDVGVDLVAMATTCARAASRLARDPSDRSPLELADLFCRTARRRIAASFRAARSNDDRLANRVAAGVLESRYAWLERGMLEPLLEDMRAEPREARSPAAVSG